MDFEAEATVFIAALRIGRQFADELGRAGGAVDILTGRQRIFTFANDRDVGVVAPLVENETAPATHLARCRAGRVVRVRHHGAVGGVARADAVIVQVGEYDREPGLSQDLDRAADAIEDIQRRTGSGEASIHAGQLDNQALRVAALQTQPAVGVMVIHRDRALHDVHDVRIVPNALGRQFLATDHDAVGRVAGQLIQADQRAVIVREP